MAGSGNQVTLTFAGDSDQLSRALDQVGQHAQRMGQQVGTTESAFDTAARSSSRFGAALDTTIGASGQVADGLDGIGAASAAMTDAMSYSERKAEELADTQQDIAQAAQDVEQAMADMRQAIRDATQAGLDAEQAGIDLEQALLDQAAAQKAYNAAVKEFGPNSAQAKQAKLDLKQADLDAKQATEDAKQANEDLKQANLDAAQAALDQTDAQNRLTKSNRELGEQSSTLTKIGEYAGMASGVIGGLAGVLGLVTVAQWAWNASLLASPVTWIVLGIGLLVGAIVLIATKTTWFQDLWAWAWGGIKKAASSTWDFIKKIPDWTAAAFSKIADVITWPYRKAFNGIASLWNSTIGALSWTVPSWIPAIGGNTISVPDIPVFHSGGIMPGAPGQEGLALLEAGERITPTNQVNGGRSIGPDDLRMPSGAGLDAMFMTWLQGLLRRNGMRLVTA
ncbi:hypothetical protein ACQSSU_03175 [Micromonospora echinospora]